MEPISIPPLKVFTYVEILDDIKVTSVQWQDKLDKAAATPAKRKTAAQSLSPNTWKKMKSTGVKAPTAFGEPSANEGELEGGEEDAEDEGDEGVEEEEAVDNEEDDDALQKALMAIDDDAGTNPEQKKPKKNKAKAAQKKK